MKKQLFVLLAVLLCLSACGASGAKELATDNGAAVAMDTAPAPEPQEAGWVETAAEMPAEETALSDASGGDTNAENANYAAGLKIIRTGDLSLETEHFDAADAFIRKTVSAYEGLLAERSISGTDGYRYATYTARIPAEAFDDFFQKVPGDCTVINQTISAEDVTEHYTDLSTRLETAKKKYDRLLELLDTAKTLTDLYSIQSEISDVEYEIDSLTGTLNGLDSRISYSTIYIKMSETNRQSAVPEDRGFLASMSAALKNGTNDLVISFQDFLIFMAYHWLACLVLVIVLVFVLLMVRRVRRKKRAKQAASTEEPQAPPADSE